MIDPVSISAPEPGRDGALARGLVLATSLAGGIALGVLVTQASLLLLALLAGGLAGAIMLASRPATGLWFLLGATSLISYYGSMPFVGIDSIHVPDLLLFYVFGVCIVHILKRRLVYVPTPCNLPYFALIGVALVSFGYGLLVMGVNLMEAFREFKVYLYYGVFLLVPTLIRDPATLREFMIGCFIIAVIASLDVIVGGILHPPPPNASEDEIYYSFSGVGAGSGGAATGGGGAILIFWAVCCLLTLLLVEGVRPLYLAILGILFLFYILKFHRHMYLIIGLTLGLTGLIVYTRYRRTILRLAGLGVVAAILAAAGVFWGPASLYRYADLSVKRLASLKGIESTSTVTIRLLENHYAWKSVREHPLFGIGFSARYRPAIYGPDDNLFTFVHNGFLWIMVKVGVIGFACFCWLLGLHLKRGLAMWHQTPDPFRRAIVLGSTVALVGMAIGNAASPYFMQSWGVCAFGMMIGVNEAVYAMNRRERREARP